MIVRGEERHAARTKAGIGEAHVRPSDRPPAPPRPRLHTGKIGNAPKRAACVTALWGRHPGADAFVVGSGTSLASFDFSRLAGRLTIALNDAGAAPHLDPAYHLWHDTALAQRYAALSHHERTIVVCPQNGMEELTQHARCAYKERIFWFDRAGTAEVEQGSFQLYVDRTIATAGIQLAWKLGARRVFLLGVDGYRRPDGAYYWTGAEKIGWKGERKDRMAPGGLIAQDRHRHWQRNMDRLRKFFSSRKLFSGKWPEAGVYNLSRWSTIDAWEKVAEEEALAEALRV